MSDGLPAELAALSDSEIDALPPDEVRRALSIAASLVERGDLRAWRVLARAGQLPPDGPWSVWLILAGRGWGKTRTGAEWAADRARRYPGCRIALVAQSFADGRDTMVEGESGPLSVLAEHELRGGSRERAWNRSLGELKLRNGSRFKVYSSEKPRQLRGPSHHFAWGDEPATWYDAHLGPSEDTTWANLEIGCRLPLPDGSDPQIVVTGTPKPVRLLTQRDKDPLGLLHRADVAITRGHTDENVANLARSYRERVIEPLRGTRLGRQELAAEVLEDVPGALWRREWIDRHRRREGPSSWLRRRIALDPSDGTATGAEQGIAIVGLGSDHGLYVIDSLGLRTNPYGMCRRAIDLSAAHGNAPIVVEKNHGGEALRDLLELAMRELGRRAPYHMITASKGKLERADPIAALYEQEHRGVCHLGHFIELEDQMVSYTGQGKSPDRLDALVHGLTELMGGAVYSGGGGEVKPVPWSDRRKPGGAVPWDDGSGATFSRPTGYVTPFGRYFVRDGAHLTQHRD